jgi:hypothetical protein
LKTSSAELTAIRDNKIDSQLAAFIVAKEAQVESLAKKATQPVPKIVQDYFTTAIHGDWITASNTYTRFRKLSDNPSALLDAEMMEGLFNARQPVIETFGAWEQYHNWDAKFIKLYGDSIIASIPAKSIYFGGTDPGRFLISSMCESHVEGRPFFTLTQNALADSRYLTYLKSFYGEKIYIPDLTNSQSCFSEYAEDVKVRLNHDRDFPNEPRQIRPGEDVRVVDNRLQISGQVGVMAVNALLVKVIFDKNPDREFYIEESFPLDWMYRYLTPHQFIMKLNREPLKEIPTTTIRADRDFWIGHMNAWYGNWLNTNTPVSEVTEFAQKIYLKHDLNEFRGDPRFVADFEAQKAFSKLRSSIGGVYAWRATNSKSSAERQRMKIEADFAFRQAFLTCPVNPEVIFPYVNLLTADARTEDALLIAITAHKLDIENTQLEDLVNQLLRTKKQADKAASSK